MRSLFGSSVIILSLNTIRFSANSNRKERVTVFQFLNIMFVFIDKYLCAYIICKQLQTQY